MRYYPVFVHLKNKDCLVVGAGDVGKRKIKSLLEARARTILVIDTHPADDELASMVSQKHVIFECRAFQASDVESKFLVIASTSNKALNQEICELCERRNTLCNSVDQPELGSFTVPATVKRGDLTLAISTSGQSPAMTRQLRRDLANQFGDEYARFLTFMGRLRPLLLALGMETKNNTKVFREMVGSPLLKAMKEHNLDAAREILKKLLPSSLHTNIPELLDELV